MKSVRLHYHSTVCWLNIINNELSLLKSSSTALLMALVVAKVRSQRYSAKPSKYATTRIGLLASKQPPVDSRSHLGAPRLNSTTFFSSPTPLAPRQSRSRRARISARSWSTSTSSATSPKSRSGLVAPRPCRCLNFHAMDRRGSSSCNRVMVGQLLLL